MNHLQPQALELEEHTRSLMIEQDAYPKISAILSAESFYIKNQVIFKAVAMLH